MTRRLNQWGLMLGVAGLLVSLWALCDFAWAQSAPPLVSIERADAVYGPQHIECWLDYSPAAFQYAGAVMLIDCHSDVDVIFRNSFEPLPERTP